MAELKTYKQKVARLLAKWERARNDDGVLYAHYINTYHPSYVHRDAEDKPYVRLEDLKNLASPDTINRCRQIIQNVDGLYLPTDPAVRKARKIKEENYRNCEVREANNTPV